jgi:hypothetical protein
MWNYAIMSYSKQTAATWTAVSRQETEETTKKLKPRIKIGTCLIGNRGADNDVRIFFALKVQRHMKDPLLIQ